MQADTRKGEPWDDAQMLQKLPIYIYIYITLWLLALAGCGASSPVYGLEPVLEPDAEELAWAELLGGENCLVLRYSAPGAGSLRAAVYELRGGAWEESGAAVEFPSVSEEGVLLLSFDSLPGGFEAAVLQPDGVEQTLAAGALAAPRSEANGMTFITAPAEVAPGGSIAAAMHYYADGGQAIAADMEDFGRPESLAGYEAVYALAVTFS